MGVAGVSGKFLGLPQFVVKEGALTSSGRMVLGGREAVHLKGARRLREGELVRVADGTGWVVVAQIEEISREKVLLRVVHDLGSHDDLIPCTFILSLIRYERFEAALARLSEMGVAVVQPVITRRSRYFGTHPQRLEKRLNRWQNICFESLKQSRGFKATLVRRPKVLPEALKNLSGVAERIALYASERGKGFFDVLETTPITFPCAVAIGPEGGFDPEEKELLMSMDFRAAGLGSRILRSETAAIYLGALLSEIFLKKRLRT